MKKLKCQTNYLQGECPGKYNENYLYHSCSKCDKLQKINIEQLEKQMYEVFSANFVSLFGVHVKSDDAVKAYKNASNAILKLFNQKEQ